MRKIKFAGLLAMAMVITLLLSSCGGTANVKKVLNPDYDISAEYYTKAENVAELNDYAVIDKTNDFIVFATGEGATLTQKVFSLRKGAVVQTLSTTDVNTAYSVQLLMNMPMYCVGKTVFTEGEDDKVTYTYYDATGAELLSIDAEDLNTSPRIVSGEILLDHALYTVDAKTGAMTKRVDIPEYIQIPNYGFERVNEYYYVTDDERLLIYNEKFEPIVVWEAPIYANSYDNDDRINMHVLNNGNVLVQYFYPVEDDAKKYDFIACVDEVIKKFELVSTLITPKGEEKELKLDYLVHSVIHNGELYDEDLEKEENRFTNKFENIATIQHIKNKKIDINDDNLEFVLMNNNGKVQKSLNIVEDQDSPYAEKIGDDLYTLETGYGFVIVNGNGKVLNTVTSSSLRPVGGYFVGDRAIYDLELNEVYNLREKDATVLGTVGDTVFIKQGEDTAYSIIALREGTETTICTYHVASADNVSFELVPTLNGYVITNAAKTEYKYYSADGTLLITTSVKLEYVGGSADTIMMWNGDSQASAYYYFAK